jgi:hypothetical protein
MVLCGHKEEGLGGVEGHAGDPAAVLAEGVLRRAAGQLVHQHRLHRAGAGGRAGGQEGGAEGMSGAAGGMWSGELHVAVRSCLMAQVGRQQVELTDAMDTPSAAGHTRGVMCTSEYEYVSYLGRRSSSDKL